MIFFRWFAVVLVSFCGLAQADIYRVGSGSDADCTHPNISAALAAAMNNPLPEGQTREIRIAQGQYLLSAGLDISNAPNDLLIVGGYPACASSSPANSYDTTVIELDQPGQRLLTINQSASGERQITLRRVTLRGQEDGPTEGGIVRVGGEATLALEDYVQLESGNADQGGAVYLAGGLFGRLARLRMTVPTGAGAEPRIRNNRARRGGGVLCGFSAEVEIGFGTFDGNFATEDGGAIYASPCAGGIKISPINRPALSSHLVKFMSNQAGDSSTTAYNNRGGAIYLDGNSLLSTHEQIQIHPNFPVWFFGNQADQGGAIYASGSSVQTTISMDTPSFLSNTARQRGGALYLRGRVDAHLYTSQPARCWVFEGEYSDPSCHYYRLNQAQGEGAGSNTHGGVFYLDNGGSPSDWNPSLLIERAHMFQNSGRGAMIGHADMGASMAVHSSTFVNNNVSTAPLTGNYLFHAQTDQTFHFRHNTVASNNNVAAIAGAGPLAVHIHGSLIWNPGQPAWVNLDPSASIQWGGCALVNSLDNFPSVPGLPLTGDPRLSENLTLNGNSPAIDRCSVDHLSWIEGGELDQQLNPRGQAVTSSTGTPVDIGSRELVDEIFRTRFSW